MVNEQSEASEAFSITTSHTFNTDFIHLIIVGGVITHYPYTFVKHIKGHKENILILGGKVKEPTAQVFPVSFAGQTYWK